MKLIDLVHSEGDKGSYLPSLLELTQALGGLVADVENAKRFSNVQLDLLDQRLEEFKSKSNSLTEERDEVIEERDEALRSLSALREQLDINVKEKEQLSQQVSDMRSQLEELERARKESLEARHQAELVLLQLGQVQEELEHYFLLSRHQSELLKANEDLQARFALLLANAAH